MPKGFNAQKPGETNDEYDRRMGDKEARRARRASLREWRATLPIHFALPRKSFSRQMAIAVTGRRKKVSSAEHWRRWWAERRQRRHHATQERHPERARPAEGGHE